MVKGSLVTKKFSLAYNDIFINSENETL